MSNQHFESIGMDSLASVAGGKSSTDQQLTLMLTQISSAIKEVGNKNQNQSDPMMMMMMMMMMGGGGGSQQVVAPPPPPPPAAPTVVKVNVRGRGGFPW